ncbi:TRAP transporter small permease subunit [Halovulum sp. GXIMD14793]
MRWILDLCALPGRWVGWLILPLIASVCAALYAAQVGFNAFWDWDGRVFLLGDGITANSMMDLQWYLFAVISLFGGVLAFRDNGHVSVDFLSSRFPPKMRTAVQILGDLLFLLPFCAIMCWYGTKFAITAFNAGEGSSYGGLMDRWVIKACLPLAFGLLGVSALARVGLGIKKLIRND